MTDELLNKHEPFVGETLTRLSAAFVKFSGDPVISLRTEISTQFDAIYTRFSAIDKATELQHQDLVRVPTQVQLAVSALEGKQDYRFKAIEELAKTVHDDYVRVPTLLDRAKNDILSLMIEKVNGVSHVFDERFARIDGAFVELNRQTTVLRSTDQLALAAALQTAEKAVNKTELNTADAIKALRLAFDDQMKAVNAKIDDVAKNMNAKIDAVTSRLDKGEGVSRGSADEIREIMAARSVQHGSNQNLLHIVTIIVALLIAAAGWLTRSAPAIDQSFNRPVNYLHAQI